ncbi:MAG: hypothetical protein ABJA82_01610 [Myxococcales bacterium]
MLSRNRCPLLQPPFLLLMPVVLLGLTSCDASNLERERGGPFADSGTPLTDGALTDGVPKDGSGSGAGDAKKDGGSTADSAGSSGDGRVDVVGSGSGNGNGNGSGTTGGVAGASSEIDGGGGRGGTGGGGAAALPTCEECEQASCAPGGAQSAYFAAIFAACHNPKDASGQPAKAMGGPAAGMLKKNLCEAVLSCVRQNPDKCVTFVSSTPGSEDISGCYCGKGVDQDTECASGKASGPCKTQIENATEISSQQSGPSDVGQRLVDWSGYAIGAAAVITGECDIAYCRASCLGLPGPNSLFQASGGTGGTPSSGSGGRSAGTGGVTGSGGSGSGSGSGGTTGTAGMGGAAARGGAGGTTGAATGGAAGGAVSYKMCRACEDSMCPDFLRSCENAAGIAATGPGMGTSRKDLCLAVVACVRAKKCSVEGDVAPCYCGTASPDGDCQAGKADGVCKAQIEAAAESTDPGVVTGERFTNPDPQNKMPYAIGFATDLIGCDGFLCPDARCVTGDPATATGSGGAVGTGGHGSGGTVGTGGGVGIGGAVATGGRLGSGGGTSTGGGGGTSTGGGGGTSTGGSVGTGGVPVVSGGAVGTGGGGTGGGSTSSGGTSNSGGSTGTGGTTGAAGALGNSTFDAGSAPWTAEFGMTTAWAASRDAAGSGTSGALGVTNASVVDADGSTMGGARQCVAVTPGISYALAGQLFLPAGQGGGSAGINILFYASADCSGASPGQYTSTLITGTNAWTGVPGTVGSPATAHSMAVRLVVAKTFRAPAFQAYFDNVSLTPQ